MIKKFLTTLLLVPCCTALAYGAVTIHVPSESQPDVNIKQTRVIYEADTWGDRIMAYISFINKYLWIAVGLVCFGFVVYNGFKLVGSWGQSEVFKKSLKGLWGAVVGVVICFLSYGAVRLIIGLFLE